MELDGDALGKALSLDRPLRVHRELCRAELDVFRKALESGEAVHVACTQEAMLFGEIADEQQSQSELSFTNIRELAGWSGAGAKALPKMAALIAEAAHSPQMVPSVTLKSSGVCLVVGAGQQVLDAAARLIGRLSPIAVLIDAADAMPPSRVEFPIFKGRVRSARGALGQFAVVLEDYARTLPSSRDGFAFEEKSRTQEVDCDVILDLSGGSELFPGHGRRDGYVSADPSDPAQVARALFDVSDLVGEFEKPRYVAYDAGICAHARSGQVGCTNCLDVCPLGAIQPAGDIVSIDAAVCGGCGNCASVCPTGAASYVLPSRRDLIARMSILVSRYLEAGGERPILLAHDEKHGTEMIGALARFGRGLPKNVIPLALNSVLMLGHDGMAAALAVGAERLLILAPPQHPEELASLEAQMALANSILEPLGYGEDRVGVIVERDPDAVEAALYDATPLAPMKPHQLVALGSKREVARSVFAQLHEAAPAQPEIIELPAGSPYGRIDVDIEGCTLCLSCVSACPANALRDDPDKPQLSFVEAACVQCGVCVATCPEKVISLEPRYNFTSQALAPHLIKAEEPFHCISCGKAFGAKSSIDRIVDRLRGHSMFPDEEQLKLIQMCDNCRVVALATSKNDPFAAGEKPRVRTTDDYLAESGTSPANGKKRDDFIG
jgi:ferredoxin